MQPDTEYARTNPAVANPLTEQLLRKINRSLRAIKVLLGVFFVMIIAMLAILGYMAYKVVTFTHEVTTKIDSFESKTSQTLDVKSKLCDNNSIEALLRTNSSSSDLCN